MTIKDQICYRVYNKYPVAIKCMGKNLEIYFSKDTYRNKFCNTYKEFKERIISNYKNIGLDKNGTIIAFELAKKIDENVGFKGEVELWLEKENTNKKDKKDKKQKSQTAE